MIFPREPLSMRSLMVTHQEKWLVFSTLRLYPINRKVSNQVRNITTIYSFFIFRSEYRVIIFSLIDQDFPGVKSGRIRFQMPFSKNRGLISILAQNFGHRRLDRKDVV